MLWVFFLTFFSKKEKIDLTIGPCQNYVYVDSYMNLKTVKIMFFFCFKKSTKKQYEFVKKRQTKNFKK